MSTNHELVKATDWETDSMLLLYVLTNDISTQVILKLLEIGGQKLISISTEVIMKLINIGGHELVMQEVHDGI